MLFHGVFIYIFGERKREKINFQKKTSFQSSKLEHPSFVYNPSPIKDFLEYILDTAK